MSVVAVVEPSNAAYLIFMLVYSLRPQAWAWPSKKPMLPREAWCPLTRKPMFEPVKTVQTPLLAPQMESVQNGADDGCLQAVIRKNTQSLYWLFTKLPQSLWFLP